MAQRRTISPYQRYGKAPHVYSPTLQQLLAARIRGDHHEADRLARVHSRRYDMRGPIVYAPNPDDYVGEKEINR